MSKIIGIIGRYDNKDGVSFVKCNSEIINAIKKCGGIPLCVLEVDNKLQITTEEFYQELKDTYGTYAIINSIDKLLLNKVYETTSDMKTKIEAQITKLKSQFGSDFESAINYYYGVSTEKQLYDYIEMAYKRELAVKEYANTLIKDEDINKYYEEKAIGDIKASHILIKSDASSSATDDEKKKAEEKALEKAKEIIKKLDDGEKFEDLAKEYSEDSSASDAIIPFFNDFIFYPPCDYI